MKKEISVSLEQAKIMYKHEALKDLVLQVFSKEELEMPTYKEVVNKVQDKPSLLIKSLYYNNMAMIAEYLNEDWVKDTKNEGYFIANDNYLESKDVLIGKHTNVLYPNVIYFKSIQTLKTAVKWLNTYKLDFK